MLTRLYRHKSYCHKKGQCSLIIRALYSCNFYFVSQRNIFTTKNNSKALYCSTVMQYTVPGSAAYRKCGWGATCEYPKCRGGGKMYTMY